MAYLCFFLLWYINSFFRIRVAQNKCTCAPTVQAGQRRAVGKCSFFLRVNWPFQKLIGEFNYPECPNGALEDEEEEEVGFNICLMKYRISWLLGTICVTESLFPTSHAVSPSHTHTPVGMKQSVREAFLKWAERVTTRLLQQMRSHIVFLYLKPLQWGHFCFMRTFRVVLTTSGTRRSLKSQVRQGEGLN